MILRVFRGLIVTLIALPLTSGAPVRATIVVTTNADVENGNVSTVAALQANAGPDGISLREAVAATNNDPGVHTIRFAAPMVITIASPFVLTGGNVSIEGPATLAAQPGATPRASGLQLASGGNRLTGLTLDGFLESVEIRPTNNPVPVGQTYADNTIEQLTILRANRGILLTFYSFTCDPCQTGNTWRNVTIRNNVIEAERVGIGVSLMSVVGDRVDGLVITGNTVRLGTATQPSPDGAAVIVTVDGNSVSSAIRNLTIENNTIDAAQSGADGAIYVGSGLQRGRSSLVEDVRIVNNRITTTRPAGINPCCHGITVVAGTDYFAFSPSIGGSPDDNVIRRVEVSDNQMSGPLLTGVDVHAGVAGGGSRNRTESVRVRRNAITSTILGTGVSISLGLGQGNLDLGQALRVVTGNVVTDVDVEDNVIVTGTSGQGFAANGISLLGGAGGGRDGVISHIRLTRNTITALHNGIRFLGGDRADDPPRGNSIRCVTIVDNRIIAAQSILAEANSGNAFDNSVIFTTTDVSAFAALLTDMLVDVDASKATGC
jgi:hypothetical protein